MSAIVYLHLTAAELAEVRNTVSQKRPFDNFEAQWRATTLRVLATHQPDRPLTIDLYLCHWLSRIIDERNRGGQWEHLETALAKINRARWPHVYPQAVPA